MVVGETSMMVATLTTLVVVEVVEIILTTKVIWEDLVAKETRTLASTTSSSNSKVALVTRCKVVVVGILETKATPSVTLLQLGLVPPLVVETSPRSLTMGRVLTMVLQVTEGRCHQL